jgi:hypothetical protein
MSGAIHPFPQYAFMAWCLVKAKGQLSLFTFTLREEHRLRVFDNRVLKRIFGSKKVEVAGSWSIPHNEGLHKLDLSPNIIRVTKLRKMRGRNM